MREHSLELLAPVAREPFRLLAAYLAEHSGFIPFETYRAPDDQARVKSAGRSKAGPFESAHQFGLAVDFVTFKNGEWVWPPTNDPSWRQLAVAAARFGLRTPIGWDRAHVEHPAFDAVRRATR